MVLFLLFLIRNVSSACVQGTQESAYQIHSPHSPQLFFQAPLVLCRPHCQADMVHCQVHRTLVENSCPMEHYYHTSLNQEGISFS